MRFAVAVHLLTLLAESPGSLVDSRELAVSPATNPVHVRRVLGQLRDEGLVTSQPGSHGGWTLAHPAEQINLGDVWRAVNDDDPLLGLHTPDPDCPTGRRVQSNLRSLDRRSLAAVIAELDGVTIADMLGDANATMPSRTVRPDQSQS